MQTTLLTLHWAVLHTDGAVLQEAKLAQAQSDIERLREETAPRKKEPAITDDALAALQARMEALHAAQLLADDELFVLEDLLADYVELKMSTPGQLITEQMLHASPWVTAASKLHKLVGLSAAMVGDAAFARQARRKYL